jgi:transglutaminase-like putative cysteine protease
MLPLALALFCAANPVPRLEPTPKWVEHVDLPLLADVSDGAVRRRLDERQVHVAPGVEQTYYRNAYTALNVEGIDTVAHTEIVFNPAYEKLSMHGVWLWHDGVRRDAWRTTDVRVLDQEEHMEDRVYDGRRSVVLETHNVHVGDTVEVAWSTRGTNPVMAGHFYGRFHTQFEGWADRLFVRVLWDKPTPPQVRALDGAEAPEERQLGNALELRWVGDDVEGFDEEPNAPADAQSRPSIEISEWKSWSEVAAWATSLFDRHDRSPLLEAELERLRALPEGEPRLREAVRFVQDEVRYLSASMGASSHRPHSSQWVLERGFGDCKDKTLLAVTLLRALGADAVPALVNTESGAAVDGWLPSPYAFDHVIVRAVLDGRETWIDATLTFERGSLLERKPPGYARALLVAPESEELVPIPLAELDEPTYELEQHWEVPQHTGPAHLTVTTRVRADEADVMRKALAGKSRAEWTRDLLDVRQDSEKLELTAEPLEWTDDIERNELVRVERYQVAQFFDSDWRHDFDARAVWNQLEEPAARARTAPLAVTHPVHLREVIVFDGPEELDPAPIAPSHLESSAYAYDFEGHVDGSRLRLEHRLRSKADRVAPAQLEEHARTVKQIAKALAYAVELPPQATVRAAGNGPAVGGGIALGVLMLMGLGLLLLRRRVAIVRAAPARHGPEPQDDLPGESPHSALAVPDFAAALGTFRTNACRNAHGWTSPPERDGTIVLGDERLTVLKRCCGTCGDVEVRYFKVPPDTAS